MEGVQFHRHWLDVALYVGLTGTGGGATVSFASSATVSFALVDDTWLGDPDDDRYSDIATGSKIFDGSVSAETVKVTSDGVFYLDAGASLTTAEFLSASKVVESVVTFARHTGKTPNFKLVFTHAGVSPKTTLANEIHTLNGSPLDLALITNSKPYGLPVYNYWWRQIMLAGLQGNSATELESSHTVKCILLNEDYVFDATDQVIGDIDSSYYVTTVANAKTLTGWSVSSGVVDSTTNPVFVGGSDFNTSNGAAAQALIYLSGLSGPNATMLIACLPIARMNQNAQNMTVEWSSSGLFTVSAVA